MKPNVFIGSSVENLELAYAIQENLEYDGNITVWSQGIFKLSSTALDDLINALDNYDFAIFIFKPDDLVNMRGDVMNIVRDNVIFELGLFIGKLGKSRVFYLAPRSAVNLHLPTDLFGHTYGMYDDLREDGNLKASLGAFCNQVREQLKQFVYINLSDFNNESKTAKNIIVNKPRLWEFELAIELLNTKLISINLGYEELAADKIIQRKIRMDKAQLIDFVQNSLETVISMADQFKKVLSELTASFGLPGVSGKAIEIKNAVDRLIQIARELLLWEYEVNSIVTSDSLTPIVKLVNGWSSVFIEQFNNLAPQLSDVVEEAKLGKQVTKSINLVLGTPKGLDKIAEFIKNGYD